MKQQFAARQWVPFPVEMVFAFFADPLNLPRLMPPALKTRIEEARIKAPPRFDTNHASEISFANPHAGVGSEILISFCPFAVLPYRVRWMARITEFVWKSHFCDEQIQGPFAFFRHRHGTIAEIRNGQMGTLVTDDIEFALPLGAIGTLASAVVRSQLQRSFAARQMRLPKMLESAANVPSTPA